MSTLRSIGPRGAALLALTLVLACEKAADKTVSAAGPPAEARGPTISAAPAESPVADRALQPWQRELLDIAYRAVSALPLDPHIKDRSTAQEKIVQACLELAQPSLALRYLEDIRNWRAGTAYADYAFWLAEQGEKDEARRVLALAAKIADDPQRYQGLQEWRRDRIRAHIARTLLLLGDREQAAGFVKGILDSETGPVTGIRADLVTGEDFDAHLVGLDEAIATLELDRVRIALDACALLHDRFYSDEARRTELERRVKTAYAKLPVEIRLELLQKLVTNAIGHGDEANAQAILDEALALLKGVRFLPQDYVRLRGRLARLRHLAGATEAARHELEVTMATYRQERRVIVDLVRPDALRPVAEAWHAIGDRARTLEVYKLAVEEGVHNPNSRPRAEDLAETCCSLALNGVEPDAALRARLNEICEGLGHPW